MRSLLLMLVAACGSSPSSAGGPDAAEADAAWVPPPDAPVAGSTILGTFVQGAYAAPPALPYTGQEPPPPSFAQPERIAIAKDLHAAIQRTQIRYGGPGVSTGGDFAAQIEAAGLQLALTTLSQPPNADGSTPPLAEADVPAFQANLDATLTALSPAVVMVENEEIAPSFYSGTPSTYALELAAAVSVAHAHHIPITNGGLTNNPCRLLTWYAFYTHGDLAAADAFAVTGLKPGWRAMLPSAANPDRPIPQSLQTIIDLSLAYMAVFAASDMDYLNMHLYEADASTMRLVVDYLAAASHKPVMTGELGQYDEEGSTVTDMLGVALEKQFPFVIWYSGDGNPAVALVDSSGPSAHALRAGGTAFRALAIAEGQ